MYRKKDTNSVMHNENSLQAQKIYSSGSGLRRQQTKVNLNFGQYLDAVMYTHTSICGSSSDRKRLDSIKEDLCPSL